MNQFDWSECCGPSGYAARPPEKTPVENSLQIQIQPGQPLPEIADSPQVMVGRAKDEKEKERLAADCPGTSLLPDGKP